MSCGMVCDFDICETDDVDIAIAANQMPDLCTDCLLVLIDAVGTAESYGDRSPEGQELFHQCHGRPW